MAKAHADILEDRPGVISVRSHYRLAEALKRVPGARWQLDGSKIWEVPLRWGSCLALRAELGEQLELGYNLIEWATAEKARVEEMLGLRSRMDIDPCWAWGPVAAESWWDGLFDHQKVGARMIERAGGRLLLFDSVGCGKTRAALAGLASLDCPLPALVVAPKSVLRTWEREIHTLWPEADVRIVDGTPTKRRKALEPGAEWYIIGYGGLRGHSSTSGYGSVKLTDKQRQPKELQEIEFRSVIADEAHRLMSPKSIQTRSLWSAAGGAPYRLALTGSPIQESPEDLWSLLRFVDPGQFAAKTPFVERFLNVELNFWGGREVIGLLPRNADEFKIRLDSMSRRMTLDMVAPQLPPKIFEERWVEMPPAGRRVYKKMKKDLIADLSDAGGEGVLVAESTLTGAGRLLQLCNGSGEAIDVVGDDGEIHQTFQMTESWKVTGFLSDLADGDFDDCAGLVVFSDSRQVADICSAGLDAAEVDHVYVNGSVTGDDRQAAIDRFQSGDVDVLLMTRAMGEGVSLPRADTMVRLVRSFSSVVHNQVEGRVYRITSGHHDVVKYIDYIVSDSVERKQLEILSRKERQSQEVLRDAELRELLAGD